MIVADGAENFVIWFVDVRNLTPLSAIGWLVIRQHAPSDHSVSVMIWLKQNRWIAMLAAAAIVMLLITIVHRNRPRPAYTVHRIPFAAMRLFQTTQMRQRHLMGMIARDPVR